MWGSVPETNSMPSAIPNAMLHGFGYNPGRYEPRRPNTMRARARQATEILKTQLLGTGAIEPLVALYFDDHIEQVEFQDPPSWNTLTSGLHGASTTCEPW